MRKAADIACKSLHKVTVRACDGATMDKTGVYTNRIHIIFYRLILLHLYITVTLSEFKYYDVFFRY